MPELRLDFHLHSDRSDGRFTPASIVERALAGRLDVLALTDHDLPPALTAGMIEGGGHRLRVVEGVELSGTHEGREFHLLVWFRDRMPEAFRAFLRARAMARAERYDAAALALGLPLAGELARAGAQAMTRHHLARALVEHGRVRSTQEAWPLLAGKVPLIELAFLDAIRVAVEAGGLTSWAHPALNDAQRHVGTFVRVGLHGLEADRPGLDRPTRNGLRRLAKRHRMLVTGGSDWHGWWSGNLGDYAFVGEHAHAVFNRLQAMP